MSVRSCRPAFFVCMHARAFIDLLHIGRLMAACGGPRPRQTESWVVYVWACVFLCVPISSYLAVEIYVDISMRYLFRPQVPGPSVGVCGCLCVAVSLWLSVCCCLSVVVCLSTSRVVCHLLDWLFLLYNLVLVWLCDSDSLVHSFISTLIN